MSDNVRDELFKIIAEPGTIASIHVAMQVEAVLAHLAERGMVVLGPDGEPLDVRPALRATRLMLQMVDELQADAGVCVLSAWEPTIEDRPEYGAAHGRPSFDLDQAIPDHVWEAANAAYNAVDRPLADACLAAAEVEG